MGAAVGWGILNGKPVISRDPLLHFLGLEDISQMEVCV